MQIGNLNDKVSPRLVSFVFGCIIATVGLLFILQFVEEKANNIFSKNKDIQLMLKN